MKHVFLTRLALLAICIVSTPIPSTFAQSDLTTVNGVIRDASGAVVPKATVTIRNQATGAERKTTTGESGAYTIVSVPAGTHTLIIETPGFQRYQQTCNAFSSNVTSPATA